MDINQESVSTLKDIKQMMERSSRFISLSGWSGISAGLCALIGAYFAWEAIKGHSRREYYDINGFSFRDFQNVRFQESLAAQLFLIAAITFVAAFISAFFFTRIRSKKNNTPIWSSTSRRLLINVIIPMIAGGLFLVRMTELGNFGLIAPGCLIFYGLALLNASKYTLNEIRYLGMCELILGLISCWNIGYGLFFWAIGFGVLHIIYGIIMWYNYERKG